MERDEFTRQLHDALAHMYDRAHLESHQLIALLLPDDHGASAQALATMLVGMIERLKPADDLPRDSAPWRKYRCLVQRYVRLRSVAQVARDLGVGERQAMRIQAEAVGELATLLWSRLPGGQGPHYGEPGDQVVVEEVSPADGVPIQNGEAARVASLSGQQEVLLGEVLEGVLTTAANLASARRAAVSIDIPPGLPPVAVERTLLRQGLLSLLIACVDCGGCVLRWSARALSTAVELRLAVAGTTRGGRRDPRKAPAPASLAERLREDRSLRAGQHLLDLQGSTVEVVDDPDGMATVVVSLPVAQPSMVLVVDDNPDTLRLFSRYLQGRGYRSTEASSGKQAVETARAVRPAVIVLDVMMPDQDGWETLQALRNHPDTEHIPVIICSVIDQRDLALSLGACDLLAKPVNLQDLLAALERCLGDSAERSD